MHVSVSSGLDVHVFALQGGCAGCERCASERQAGLVAAQPPLGDTAHAGGLCLWGCHAGAHIPYRDSKLTRILQPSLGGNAKTSVICAITPALCHLEESHSTLRFACRAKRVVNNAVVNEVCGSAMRYLCAASWTACAISVLEAMHATCSHALPLHPCMHATCINMHQHASVHFDCGHGLTDDAC